MAQKFTQGFGTSGPGHGEGWRRLADETLRGTRFAFAKKNIEDHPNDFDVYAIGFGMEDMIFGDWYYLVAKSKDVVVRTLRNGGEFRDFRTGEPWHIVADEDGPIVEDVRETRDPFVQALFEQLRGR